MDDERHFLSELKRDCRHFRSERPCRPHKHRGVVCASCDVYDPIRERITIVKLAATGDVLRTTAFLPGLRRKYPGAWIRWLTVGGAAPLFAGNPYVDELVVGDGIHLPARLAILPQDLVLCPDADAQTASLAASIPLRDDGRRVGFGIDGDGNVVPLSEAAAHWFALGLSDAFKRANRETYQNLVGAVLELEAPIEDRPVLVLDDREVANAKSWLDAARGGSRGATSSLVGLVTGAGRRWPRKQWTLEGQIALAKDQLAKGRTVVLYGGPEESERHDALRAALPNGAILDAGTSNSLRNFAARLSLADIVVTGDTMALHMATAFGQPVVALFGPTSSFEIELYGSGAKVFAEELDCLCCYAMCDRTPSCMDLITVERVIESVDALLTATSV
ncbi:MAG: glycosyltransferase family 9 protein [Planctomycetes bacterium]|nr:glycosyltransferase family 9 protein [Planctomycetota bacterium]MCB9916911.1 glycosyltransferase family 9 protein [Planctomycetota bacterium]